MEGADRPGPKAALPLDPLFPLKSRFPATSLGHGINSCTPQSTRSTHTSLKGGLGGGVGGSGPAAPCPLSTIRRRAPIGRGARVRPRYPPHRSRP